MTKDRDKVDAETRDYLDSFKVEIKDDLKELVNDIKSYIREHTASKTDPLRVDVDRHSKEISQIYDMDRERIKKDAEIEQRLAAVEGDRSGRDHQKEAGNRQAELSWLKITGIITVVSAITGVIVYFVR